LEASPSLRYLAATTGTGLVLMSAAFYVAPDYGWVARCFYLLVLLPVALLAVTRPAALALPVRNLLIYLPLPAYLALSTLWGAKALPAGEVWDLCKPALFLAALLFGAGLAVRRFPALVGRIVQANAVVALPAALAGLAIYLPEAIAKGNWPRMAGISLHGDINVTAALHGLNCLFCAYGLRHWDGRWRPWLWAALGTSFACALLSQSKVPLFLGLAALAWLLYDGLIRAGRRHIALALAALGGGLLLAFFASFDRVPFLNRPEAYAIRVDLWRQALEQAAQHPLFGHGLGAALPLSHLVEGPNYRSHVHNVLLATLRYGGLVGAGLMLWQIGATLWLAWREGWWRDARAGLLLWWLAGIGFLLTNGGQPLVKPHHTWFFYWIPLALLLASGGRHQKPSTC
jgi:O-antigen ligase